MANQEACSDMHNACMAAKRIAHCTLHTTFHLFTVDWTANLPNVVHRRKSRSAQWQAGSVADRQTDRPEGAVAALQQ